MPRSKLLGMLKQTPEWRVLMLRAPAGYGKTTLMSLLFEHLGSAPATFCHWLTLDPCDEDPLHLLTHLQACIDRSWGSRSASGIARFADLGTWLQAVALLPGQRVLFLDELESVQSSSSVRLLHQLLRFAPDNLRIVASARPHSPIALARMKVGAGLLEWSARQLRFDDGETRALLQVGNVGRPPPPQPWLELIAQRCEGWPAALRLSALALHRSENSPRFLDMLQDNRSDLAEYLANEVFEQQPPQWRAFLLDTCVLRYLLPSLCDALCGRSDSAPLLEEMARSLQFITPLSQGPGQSGAWICHSLLQDFLRKRLDALHPGRAALLHCRAAAWLEARGLLTEAVGHGLDCGNPDFAAALVNRAARPLVLSGHLATVQQAIARLPAHIADSHPGIVWASARAHAYLHQVEEAQARFQQLRALSAQQAFDRPMREDYLALEALISIASGDMEQVLRVIQRNLSWTEGDYARGSMLNVQAYAELARMNFDTALALLDQADLHNRKALHLFGLSAAQGLRAAIWSSRGELRKALACYSGQSMDERSEYAAPGLGLRCELLYETDQLDALQALLALHTPHADDSQATDLVIGSYLAAARLDFARGNHEAAQAILDRTLARALQRNFHRLVMACRWEKVRMATLSGQHDLAQKLMPAERPDAGRFHFATDAEAGDLTWLRLLVRSGQARQALPAIAQRLAQAQFMQRGWRALKLGILHACALDALGQCSDADAALASALDTGSRQGFVRSFADEGPPVLDRIGAWLTSAAPLPAPREYLHQVLAAGRSTADAQKKPRHIDTFSQRERELLQALALGGRNQEIAQRLQLTENTVKWYLKRLYMKLDAHNRTQAIAQARRLHLLD